MRHWFPGERRDLADIPERDMDQYRAHLSRLPPIGGVIEYMRKGD